MFSICTAYIENGKIKENLANFKESEKLFTREIGVLFRKFFQCKIQPHIIWSITEWESEKAHNNAAQSIMETRRDDRFASITFGPEPYFEIFCKEDETLRIENFSDDHKDITIIHGLIGEKVKEKYLDLRKERIEEYRDKLHYVRVFHNTYNSNEFIVLLGFADEDSYKKIQKIGELYLEEYLFTGLRNPLGMSYIASYNQFICELITP